MDDEQYIEELAALCVAKLGDLYKTKRKAMRKILAATTDTERQGWQDNADLCDELIRQTSEFLNGLR